MTAIVALICNVCRYETPFHVPNSRNAEKIIHDYSLKNGWVKHPRGIDHCPKCERECPDRDRPSKNLSDFIAPLRGGSADENSPPDDPGGGTSE